MLTETARVASGARNIALTKMLDELGVKAPRHRSSHRRLAFNVNNAQGLVLRGMSKSQLLLDSTCESFVYLMFCGMS